MKYTALLHSILYILFIPVLNFGCNNEPIDSVQPIIKLRLQDSSQVELVIATDTIYAQSLLHSFYQYNGYHPIWSSYTLQSETLQTLIDILKQSELEGLNPEDYHLFQIEKIQQQFISSNKKEPLKLANLDMLLSDAFITLAFHYYNGKVRDIEINKNWECSTNNTNLTNFLWKSIQTNCLKQSLKSLHPPYKEYHNLQKVLVRYKEIATLYPDSLLLQEYITKISINMERWRWLPKSTDSTYIIANIPAFQLWLYHNDTVVMNMKTIVGKPDNPTPPFNCKISYVVLRPRWKIPTSIVKKEILPEVLKDSSYLARNHIWISHTWKDSDTNYISPDSIKWDNITINNFPYKMVQSAGPWNSLGEIKLMFPNQFNVYLHDTPNHSLFNKDIRAFSHGCIRIEKAEELAAYITKNDTFLNIKNYNDIFQENERINLKSPITISINYWTAWSKNSDIIFFEDIYNKDIYLEIAMKKKPLPF